MRLDQRAKDYENQEKKDREKQIKEMRLQMVREKDSKTVADNDVGDWGQMSGVKHTVSIGLQTSGPGGGKEEDRQLLEKA